MALGAHRARVVDPFPREPVIDVMGLPPVTLTAFVSSDTFVSPFPVVTSLVCSEG